MARKKKTPPPPPPKLTRTERRRETMLSKGRTPRQAMGHGRREFKRGVVYPQHAQGPRRVGKRAPVYRVQQWQVGDPGITNPASRANPVTVDALLRAIRASQRESKTRSLRVAWYGLMVYTANEVEEVRWTARVIPTSRALLTLETIRDQVEQYRISELFRLEDVALRLGLGTKTARANALARANRFEHGLLVEWATEWSGKQFVKLWAVSVAPSWVADTPPEELPEDEEGSDL